MFPMKTAELITAMAVGKKMKKRKKNVQAWRRTKGIAVSEFAHVSGLLYLLMISYMLVQLQHSG